MAHYAKVSEAVRTKQAKRYQKYQKDKTGEKSQIKIEISAYKPEWKPAISHIQILGY